MDITSIIMAGSGVVQSLLLLLFQPTEEEMNEIVQRDYDEFMKLRGSAPNTLRTREVIQHIADDGFDEGYDQARAPFDMAAVAIVKNPTWAVPSYIPSPELVDTVWYERPENERKIIIWENFNKEAIMADFYHTMENYVLVDDGK